MRVIQSFDPSIATTNPTIQVGAADAGSKILLYNLSPRNLNLDFYNGNNSILHAWEARVWTLDGETRNIGWSLDSIISVSQTPPISLVMGELYGPNEFVEGVYPISLMHQTSVGNQVSSNVSTLSNTGQSDPTNVITISDAANQTTFSLNNDGILTLAALISGAVVQLIKSSNVDPLLQLGASTHTVENLGNEKVDGTLEVVGTLTADGAETVTGILTANNPSNSVQASKVPATGITSGAIGAGVTLPGSQVTGNIAGSQINGAVASANLLNSGAANLTGGKIGVAADGDVLDASIATALYLKARTAGVLHYQSPSGTDLFTVDASGNFSLFGGKMTAGGTQVFDGSAPATKVQINAATGGYVEFAVNGASPAWVDTNGIKLHNGKSYYFVNSNSMSNISTFTGTGSGTYNHNLAATPAYIAPIVSVVGSATQGYDTVTATQCHVTLGSSLAFKAFCWN